MNERLRDSRISNDVFHLALINSSQMGVVTKFSKQIAFITNFEELYQLVLSVLDDLELQAIFRINCYGYIKTGFTDGTIDPEFYAELAALIELSTKVTRLQNAFILSSPWFLIAVKKGELEDKYYDCLLDNLTILFDITDTWICNHTQKIDFYFSIHNQRKSVLNEIQSALTKVSMAEAMAVHGHQQVSNEVMLRLATKFPSLGMEADQENQILDIVEDATRQCFSILEGQIRLEGELSFLLENAIELLKDTSLDDYILGKPDTTKNLTINESVTLF